MKYLKTFESNWKWRQKREFITDKIREDIDDIFLEFDFVKFGYSGIKMKYSVSENIISIFDRKHSSFILSDVEEVVERLKEFLKINGFFIKVNILGKNRHWSTNEVTASRIEIEVNRPLKEAFRLDVREERTIPENLREDIEDIFLELRDDGYKLYYNWVPVLSGNEISSDNYPFISISKFTFNDENVEVLSNFKLDDNIKGYISRLESIVSDDYELVIKYYNNFNSKWYNFNIDLYNIAKLSSIYRIVMVPKGDKNLKK